jgi:uncharacterized protein (TIGR02145 family)
LRLYKLKINIFINNNNEKTMKTTKLFLSLALMFFFCANLHAQVLIGGTDRPRDGAILDLNSTAKGGLILSNVTIASLELIPHDTYLFPGIDDSNADVNPELRGAMVYNDGKNAAVPAGIYIWNGCSWTKDGGGVNSLPAPPVRVNGSGSATVTVGESLELKVTALLLNVNYTWYKKNVNSNSTSAATLAGMGTTLITPASTVGTYDYYCVVASNDCSLSNGTSSVLPVTVNPINPATIPDGKANFNGKTCFDIAFSNSGGVCAMIADRGAQKTDFVNRTKQGLATASTAPYTGVQVYTFSITSAVSRVRFEYADASGLVIDSIVPESPDYEMGDGITAAQVTVFYNKDLNTALQGLTRVDALKVKLYVIYNTDATYNNDTSKDRKLELNISLQDCTCCGAFVSTNPVKWLNFLCHDLGANESADPFTPSAAIHGAKYKWGVAVPALTQAQDQKDADKSGISDWTTNSVYTTPPVTSNIPWDMENDNPCPAGWRVPTEAEWRGVINSNVCTGTGTWSNHGGVLDNYNAGYKIGYALLLPAAGNRDQNGGWLYALGFRNRNWTSNAYGSQSYCLDVDRGTPSFSSVDRSSAMSVRCVAD